MLPPVRISSLQGAPMNRAASTFVLGLIALSTAACSNPDQGTPDNKPFRDEWKTEAFVPFDHFDEENNATNIFSLTVGGRLEGGADRANFANRGDVIVKFDGPPDMIQVEFRRFTFSPNQEAADLDYEAMSLWAFNTSLDNPSPPDMMDPETYCADEETGWLSGCGIRLYYDGQSQLVRAGADIRVTLPPDYDRDLTVITEDNDGDPDYFNRGNVCVEGLQGNADVRLQSGQAFVKVARDVSIAPQCSADFIQQCEDWPCINDQDVCDGTQAWDSNCPCVAQVGEFGRVKVESHDAASADINIDVPSNLWMSITTKNEQMGQDSSDPELHCRATVDVPGYEPLDGQSDFGDFPWESRGQVNYPGSFAVSGAGYSVTAFSKGCNPVPFTDNPDGFIGAGMGSMQESTQRGNIHVCTDCIPQSCDELID
jgi:hypothetical protein